MNIYVIHLINSKLNCKLLLENLQRRDGRFIFKHVKVILTPGIRHRDHRLNEAD